MATTMTLLELRTATRQRADMENSTFVSDVELNSYINQSYFELYDLLIENFGEHYFVSAPYSITTDGTTEFYPLPTDFYKLAGLSVKITGGLNSYIPLKRGSFSDMERLSGTNYLSIIGQTNMVYALTANTLWLAPIPSAGQTVRMFYAPKLTTLSADTDTVDGVSGWTEYIICDAAIKCAQKEESEVSILAAEKSALIKRIQEASFSRDAASASTVTDTSASTPGMSYAGWGRY